MALEFLQIVKAQIGRPDKRHNGISPGSLLEQFAIVLWRQSLAQHQHIHPARHGFDRGDLDSMVFEGLIEDLHLRGEGRVLAGCDFKTNHGDLPLVAQELRHFLRCPLPQRLTGVRGELLAFFLGLMQQGKETARNRQNRKRTHNEISCHWMKITPSIRFRRIATQCPSIFSHHCRPESEVDSRTSSDRKPHREII